jgi:hypothetical protein
LKQYEDTMLKRKNFGEDGENLFELKCVRKNN